MGEIRTTAEQRRMWANAHYHLSTYLYFQGPIVVKDGDKEIELRIENTYFVEEGKIVIENIE